MSTASTALVSAEQIQDLATSEWNVADLIALKNTIAKDCSVPQLRIFVGAAKRLGLDPFARQIVPIVQGDKMTPQVTIDGFRLIAERTGKYAGQLGPFWCGPDGEWQEVWLSNDMPTACKVGVIRRDFDQPMWGVARTAAYKSGTPTWNKMPDVMIAKVAESLALRKAFPQELSGVYSDDEMAQAQTDVVDVTPQASAQPTWDDVKRLAGELGLTSAQKKQLFNVHKQDAIAIYRNLQQMADKAIADRQEDAITFAVEGEPVEHSLEGLPVRGA